MAEAYVPGFQKPQEPKDEWTANQYIKYGLGPEPTLEAIEPIATELLSNLHTALAGAELVLGRRVDADRRKEPVVLPLITTPGFTGEDLFGLLLMERDTEAAIARNSAPIDQG